MRKLDFYSKALSWLCGLAFGVLICYQVMTSGTSLPNPDPVSRDNYVSNGNSRVLLETEKKSETLQKRREVNNATTDDNFLFFGRVPKTGSENMVFLLQKLSHLNGFTHVRHPWPKHRHLTEEEQVKSELVANLCSVLFRTVAHLAFIVFPKY